MQPTEVDYLSVRTVAELATVPTAGFPNGTTCVVAGSSFVLVDAQGAADGTTIIAAFGDPTGRQWITASLLNPVLSGVVITVPNSAALAARSAAGLADGTWAFVQTYKTYFCLIASTQPAIANVRIAASGNAGHVWERGYVTEPAWWSQLSWFVDPQNTSGTASDENSGASSVLPLATFAELSRRFRQRNLPGTETNSWSATLMSDAADTDYFQVHTDQNSRNVVINASVLGTVTPGAIGVIASATAKNSATNTSNTITVTGFDFSGLIGRIIRLVGTATTTAVIETAPSLGVATLSEQNQNSSVGAGFTAGQTVELCTYTKLPGITVNGGAGLQVFVSDCKFAVSGLSNLTVEGVQTNLVLTRCELRSTTGVVRASAINTIGCSFTASTSWEIRGTWNSTSTDFVNVPTIVHGQGSNGTDSFGTARGLGFVNSCIGLRPYTMLVCASDLHTVNGPANKCVVTVQPSAILQLNGAYYGAGNAASSAGIGLPLGGVVYYSTVPVNDCGQGVYHGGSAGTIPAPTTGGTSVAYGSLPLALTTKLNSVVQT